MKRYCLLIFGFVLMASGCDSPLGSEEQSDGSNSGGGSTTLAGEPGDVVYEIRVRSGAGTPIAGVTVDVRISPFSLDEKTFEATTDSNGNATILLEDVHLWDAEDPTVNEYRVQAWIEPEEGYLRWVSEMWIPRLREGALGPLHLVHVHEATRIMEITSPQNGASFDKPPLVQWVGVPGATRYRLRVETSFLSFSYFDTSETEFDLEGSLTVPSWPRTWELMVEAFDADDHRIAETDDETSVTIGP